MGDAELEWLYRTAQGMKSIVEVGSWMGRSTFALLSGCKGSVTAVDHWQGSPSDTTGPLAKAHDGYAAFFRNVGHFPNLTVLRMPSLKAAECFKDGSVDMAFIDGEHTIEAATDDYRTWKAKCRRLICGHDVTHRGVRDALRAMGVPYRIEAGSIWSQWL